MLRLRPLTWLEPFWILLLGLPIIFPGKVTPLRFHPYLLAALFLFWPLRWLAYHRLSRRTPLDWSVAFILLWLPVNLWASVDRDISWVAAGYLLFGLTLYVSLVNWPPLRKTPQLAAWFMLSVAGGMALISPPITAWKTEFRLFRLPQIYDLFRSIPIDLGETIHANVLAGLLVIALPLFVALSLRSGWSKSPWPRRLCLLGSLLLFVVLVLTQSRGGYMAAAIALALVTGLRWPRLFWGGPVVLAGAVAVIFWLGPNQVFEAIGADSTFGGASFRVEMWTNSLYALSDFVFTGIGIGTFRQVMPLLYPFLLISPDNASFVHAHNLYLQIGLDLGLPGLVAWLALIINVFALLIPVLRRRDRILQWTLASGVLGGLVAMLVHGFLDAVTWGTKLAFYPWLLIALAVLLGLQLQQEEAARP
jgi:putative inorganic carbon (HCO3(-)) transporter